MDKEQHDGTGVYSGLIPCGACSKEISADAATCPHCGHANTWVHPTLQRVIDHLDALDHHTKVEALGNTMTVVASIQTARQAIGSLLLLASGILLVVGLFAPALMGLAIMLMIVGGLLIGFGLDAVKQHELRIDMRTPNKVVGKPDGDFWADVIDMIRANDVG